MDLNTLRINGQRLQETIEQSAQIGATAGGGLIRCAATPEDKMGRDLLKKWYQECGCEVTIDEMGNMFAVRPGKRRSLGAVLTGSHFDTQKPGGRFDGILGVLGALEVMRVINENNIKLERDLIIANWTNEEGGWFIPACMGSGVWAGNHTKEWAYAIKDRDGITVFGEELEKIGYKGSFPASHREWNIDAAYELHIEQGPLLEQAGIQIGAPKGIVCLHWYDIYLTGTANQVGPTPMVGRNDALLAFSEMNIACNNIAHQLGNMVSTVGEIQNYPNSRNIISDRVHFTVDIRSWDDQHALKAWDLMKRECEVIAARRGCGIEFKETWKVAHAPFDPQLYQRVIDVSNQLGYSSMSMVSGAGHDMSEINQVTRGAMIFVPSIGGRSHVECEETPYEDCVRGTNVLLHCILQTANEFK